MSDIINVSVLRNQLGCIIHVTALRARRVHTVYVKEKGCVGYLRNLLFKSFKLPYSHRPFGFGVFVVP